MFEPQRMDKVLIVGTKDVIEATINTLHVLDLLHIEDYTEEGAYFHIGMPLKKSASSLYRKSFKVALHPEPPRRRRIILTLTRAGRRSLGTR